MHAGIVGVGVATRSTLGRWPAGGAVQRDRRAVPGAVPAVPGNGDPNARNGAAPNGHQAVHLPTMCAESGPGGALTRCGTRLALGRARVTRIEVRGLAVPASTTDRRSLLVVDVYSEGNKVRWGASVGYVCCGWLM